MTNPSLDKLVEKGLLQNYQIEEANWKEGTNMKLRLSFPYGVDLLIETEHGDPFEWSTLTLKLEEK